VEKDSLLRFEMSQSTLYSFSESWAPKGAQLSAVQLHPSPSLESIPVTRRGVRPATAAAAREAARRVGQWRDQQRQKRIEEEEKQGKPWFRERGVSASKLRINAWRAEALEMPTPPRSLIGLAMPPGGLGASGRAEQLLNQRLAELEQLVGRMRRFALLNEEHENKTSPRLGNRSPKRPSSATTLGELSKHSSLDERRTMLGDLLCALRVAIVGVVEAVHACQHEQTNDSCLNLNLPRLREMFSHSTEDGQKRKLSSSGLGQADASGFAAYSSKRHAAILCSLTAKVSFLPLPFEQDPLLLHWFDSKAEIWRAICAGSCIAATKVCASRQHSVGDRERMYAAQSTLLEAIKRSGSGKQRPRPRTMPPPAAEPVSAVSSARSKELTAQLVFAVAGATPGHLSRQGHVRDLCSPLTTCDTAPAGLMAATTQMAAQPSRQPRPLAKEPRALLSGSASVGTLPALTGASAASAPILHAERAAPALAYQPAGAATALARPASAADSIAEHSVAWGDNSVTHFSSAAGSAQPSVFTAGSAQPSARGMTRPSTAASSLTSLRSARSLAKSPSRDKERSASPSNLAPDNRPPADPAAEAKARLEARARAVWRGLEVILYGAEGRYARVLKALAAKEAQDARNRSMNARAHAIFLVGGVMDEDTKQLIAARALQRVWREFQRRRLELLNRKAEHTATLAILAAVKSNPVLMRLTEAKAKAEAPGVAEPKGGSLKRGAKGSARGAKGGLPATASALRAHELMRRREHELLLMKVAARRILSFFRSPYFKAQHIHRTRMAVAVQANVRRYLTKARVAYKRQKEAAEERTHVLNTMAVPMAEHYACLIQQIFQAHKVTAQEKYELFQLQTLGFANAIAAEDAFSPSGTALLAAAHVAERQVLMGRREIAISLGALPANERNRPEPITAAVVSQTEQLLAEGVQYAVLESLGKGKLDVTASSISAWVAALIKRGLLEGALHTLERLEGAWAEFSSLLGQRQLITQQLRAPPPVPPGRISPSPGMYRTPDIGSAVERLLTWARLTGTAAIVNTFQEERYTALLNRLALQRQEGLKAKMRLEFCHRLKGMRKRFTLVRMCQEALEALDDFLPITPHDARMALQLTCQDWKGSNPPELDEHAAATLCLELRDWFSIDPRIGLRAEKTGVKAKNILEVSLILFEASQMTNRPPSPTRRKVVPPTVQTVNAIHAVVEQLREMPQGRIELKRLPDLAELWGCSYIGLEVGACRGSSTEVHLEPTMAESIRAAQAEFATHQAGLDKLGAEARTRAWASKQKWYFLEGAVSWLKGQPTEALAALQTEHSMIPSASKALESKVASRMRWEHVKELVRVQEQQKQAKRNSATRKELIERQQRCAAQEMLNLVLLHVSAARLPYMPWRGEGIIDVAWNLGLSSDVVKARVHPLRLHTGAAKLGVELIAEQCCPAAFGEGIMGARLKLCLYCAGGLGGSHQPVSASHPMWQCIHRKRAGVREFPPGALDEVRASLGEEGDVLRRAIGAQATAAVEAKVARRGSYQLGGVASALSNARQRHLPGEGKNDVKAPPKHLDPAVMGGYLYNALHAIRWERKFWRSTLVQSLAEQAHVSSFKRLGDFKGLAVLQGTYENAPFLSTKCLTPARVLDAADDLGLLAGLVGASAGIGSPPPGKSTLAAPFRALWVAAEFILAPLPALWSFVPAEATGGSARWKKPIYRKHDQGEVHDFHEHPLRESYQLTARRFCNYAPQVSLKKQPVVAWYLFALDGQPCCVDMRASARKRHRFGPGWQSMGANETHTRVPVREGNGSIRREGASVGPGMEPSPDQNGGHPVGMAGTSPETRGLSICRFPALRGSRYRFAPNAPIEPTARRVMELSRASLEHAAKERLAALDAGMPLASREPLHREPLRPKPVKPAPVAPKAALALLELENAGFGDGSVRLRIDLSAFDGEESSITEESYYPRGHPLHGRSRSPALAPSATPSSAWSALPAPTFLPPPSASPEVRLAWCRLAEVDALRSSFDMQRARSLQAMPRALEEVLVMAAYLGLPYGGELGCEQLWIADAALCAQRPLGWTELTDEHGTRYYHSALSGEVMWEHPQIAFLRGVVEVVIDAERVLWPRPSL
jgi:hypothetical protein